VDINPMRVTPIPGAVSVSFQEDFLIEMRFVDSESGATILDRSGVNAVKMSALLEAMPSDVLAAFVGEVASRMVAVAGGLS
jgi:hypothetical protein